MSKVLSGIEYFSATEAAKQIGVHRLTLLRWIREGKVPDAVRDRNGWRLFDRRTIEQISDYAHAMNNSNSGQLKLFRTPIPYDEMFDSNALSVAEKSEE